MTHRCAEERFLTSVSEHEMTVLQDNGLYRHLRFRNPDTFNMWFDLITWPGTLCIDGDMGTDVFRRTEDMFRFFRNESKDGTLWINPGYWSEKLQASECRGRFDRGVQQYDPDLFERYVKEEYVRHVRENMSGMPEERRGLRELLEGELLGHAEDRESAIRAAIDFDFNGLRFDDIWETSFDDWTYHFVWRCYAIVWGIEQFDKRRARAAEAA